MIIAMFILSLFTEAEFAELKKGNPDFVEKLYLRYKNRIFVFILKKVNGNFEMAGDILSETFIEVIRSVARLKNQNNLGSWILSIAINRYRHYVRKYKIREKIIKLAAEKERYTVEDPVIEEIDKKYRYFVLETAVEQMKPLYKKVYKMKYIEEKSNKEIGNLIHKNENAVGVLLFRIKKKLGLYIYKINNGLV